MREETTRRRMLGGIGLTGAYSVFGNRLRSWGRDHHERKKKGNDGNTHDENCGRITNARVEVTSLDMSGLSLGHVTFRNGSTRGKTLDLFVSPGSGAAAPADGSTDRFYAVGDRGPNIHHDDAKEVTGLDPSFFGDQSGGKIFTNPGYTPSIYEIELGHGTPRVVNTIALADTDGHDITAISNPLTVTATEVAYSMNGARIPYDPNGMDVEAVAQLTDGTFWITEEYAPSLAHVAADGRILDRIVPAGVDADLADATYPVTGDLPAIIRRRKLNRGIEGFGVTPDESAIFFALQSPLANPDVHTSNTSRNVRIFRFDLASKSVTDEYLYRLDLPGTFEKDNADGSPDQHDVKVSELKVLGEETLLVLERVSETMKLYRVDLDGVSTVPEAFDDVDTTPTLESLDAAGLADAGVEAVPKDLAFDTDDYDGLPSKIEGVAILDDREFVLMNDSDFGLGDATPQVVRVRHHRSL
ncbi:esterase-like activity of phytase family protein [Haladaptatus sp. AB618]|uniref:esterase-like activity of phytase family protein n=1 Tax=Haladaptatus sp. AB618 TaxID=2934173 RepID=UPI00209C2EA9|nr:esterase-like activity of phytase family protein [Haladaptatus sp. AB618]MCO8254839.1 esterase-like activity of phytase family protein [Haladaptatus sp. AB618]